MNHSKTPHEKVDVSLSLESGDSDIMDDGTGVDITALATLPRPVPNTQKITNGISHYIEPVCRAPLMPSSSGVKFTPDIYHLINIFVDRSNTVRARRTSQRVVEHALINSGSCSAINSDISTSHHYQLFTLDDEKLEHTLDTLDSLNANIHDDIACAVSSITLEQKMVHDFSPVRREKIRNWFEAIKQVGTVSVEGYAIQASFSGSEHLFVIKAPRHTKNDDLIHEATIGMFAMNKLRHYLPNYMYIYGYTQCSPPVIENKDVITWCSSSSPASSYLITENIRDAVTFAEFVRNPLINRNDLLAVLLQLFNALNFAYKSYGYTHYDLHHRNVLIRKYKIPIAVPYFGTTERGTNTNPEGYIATSYIPFIIDYGYSRISIGGIGFGKLGYEGAGIEGERPFPMFDIYKIICFLGESIMTCKTPVTPDLFPLLDSIFKVFNEGKLEERVKLRRSREKDWYNLHTDFRTITHDIFLLWLHSNINPLPIFDTIEELTAQGVHVAPLNNGFDTCKFYELFGSDKGPSSALEYCDVLGAISTDQHMTEEAKQQAIAWLNDHFDAEAMFLSRSDRINELLESCNSIMTSWSNIPLLEDPTIKKTTIKFYKSYKDIILNLLLLKDQTGELLTFMKSNICALSSQDKYETYREGMDMIHLDTVKFIDRMTEQRDILGKNVKYLKSHPIKVKNSTIIQKFWDTEHAQYAMAF